MPDSGDAKLALISPLIRKLSLNGFMTFTDERIVGIFIDVMLFFVQQHRKKRSWCNVECYEIKLQKRFSFLYKKNTF